VERRNLVLLRINGRESHQGTMGWAGCGGGVCGADIESAANGNRRGSAGQANSGDAAAQVAVGESYAAGTGVPRDYKLAAEWYQKAADKGNIAGQLHLAVLYRDGGNGFERDMTRAAEWYRKAAEQGDVDAQGMMGTLYSMARALSRIMRRPTTGLILRLG